MPLDLDANRNRHRVPLSVWAPGVLLRLVVLGILVTMPSPGSAQNASYGYFTITPDPRLCPSPICGGFHLRALNQDEMTCADGSTQPSCYVATADFGILESPLFSSDGESLVRGRIESDDYPPLGDLGRFVVESGWTAATSQPAVGSFYRIRDLGIVCVTSPCFSIEGRLLNQSSSLAFSRLDLGAIDATSQQLISAATASEQGELLVAGVTGSDPGPAGEGLALAGSQFWLPLETLPRCRSALECSSGMICNAANICLPDPACEPGDPCPPICSGYCEPALCEDLEGHDFGPCDAVLGWAVIGNSCAEVSGCDAEPYKLFSSQAACAAACPSNRSVPGLGPVGVTCLALGLSVLAATRLRRRRDFGR